MANNYKLIIEHSVVFSANRFQLRCCSELSTLGHYSQCYFLFVCLLIDKVKEKYYGHRGNDHWPQYLFDAEYTLYIDWDASDMAWSTKSLFPFE